MKEKPPRIKVMAQWDIEKNKWRVVEAKEDDASRLIYEMHVNDLEGMTE